VSAPRRRGPVMFAYDGSELAKLAIARAGELLGGGREALVVCVWRPFDVGFVPLTGLQIDATEVERIREAAEQTAAAGAELAREAGFDARIETLEANPSWQGLVETAERHDADVIVFGSHGRHGPAGLLLGSVASAVASHTRRDVLIVHRDE
jgi:nucleotide-binding universal stress UspA family protein